MKNVLFVLTSVATLVTTELASAQYGAVAPQGGIGTSPSNESGQWRDNNWRNGSANDWRSNNWRENGADNWRRNNWREDRTDDWRPREKTSKDKVESQTKENAYENGCRNAPNSLNSNSDTQCR
jgi:hypothetical protein